MRGKPAMKVIALDCQGASMHNYEIRVLSSGHLVAIIEQTYLNDHAAVRAARKYAGNRSFEVWRGVDCIYGRQHQKLPEPISRSS